MVFQPVRASRLGEARPVAVDHAASTVRAGQQGAIGTQGDQLVADPEKQRTVPICADRDPPGTKPPEHVVTLARDPRCW